MSFTLKPFKDIPLHFLNNTEILLISTFDLLHHIQVWHVVGSQCLLKKNNKKND